MMFSEEKVENKLKSVRLKEKRSIQYLKRISEKDKDTADTVMRRKIKSKQRIR